MLVLHALWSRGESPGLFVWGEDGELPATGSSARRRQAAAPKPQPHPFAARGARISDALISSGSSLAAAAIGTARPEEIVVWLPGRPGVPEASSQLVRTESEETGAAANRSSAAARSAPGLAPFAVPALRLDPGPALDALLVLSGIDTPGLHAGASVTALAAVAELALEVVAGGRVIPQLNVTPGGRYAAGWTSLGGGADGERLALIAAALPPVCRALGSPVAGRAQKSQSLRRRTEAGGPRSEAHGDASGAGSGTPVGEDPALIAGGALDAFVDALCRDALRRPLVRPAGRPAGRVSPRISTAAEAWLAALGGASPVADTSAGVGTLPGEVVGPPGELAKLERLVAEWRAGAAGRGGPWRLCFRLREPDDESGDAEPGDAEPGDAEPGDAEPGDAEQAGATGGNGAAPDGPWRVELLLQATDDLSLMVEAGEVWRSGDSLRRATRTLHDPHEVLLAELGRAVRAYPDLTGVLKQAAPTAVDTDLQGAHRFLSEVAPALEIAGFGVLLPAWWRRSSGRLGVRLKATSRPNTTGSGLLDQSSLAVFDWQAALGDQEIGLAELRRLAQLKAPLVRVRGQWAELRPGDVEKLVEFLSKKRKARQPISVADALRIAAGAQPVDGEVPLVGVDADGLLGAMLRGELEDAVTVRPTPAGFAGELRPYQERGVAWIELLERLGLGACLADDMGLGKTATVLAVLQGERLEEARDQSRPSGKRHRANRSPGKRVPAPGPTLVVCPTSVVGNWQREAERFTPELKVVVHHGATRAKGEALRDEITGADLVITSYPLVERDRAALSSVEWRRVVLDEAQHVKNPSAKQTKAVRALPAPRRIALTGTPVENHLGELWSIMEILNPGLLGSESSFREQFAIPIERYREEDAAERLRTMTRPFVLRRLKTDRSIITDLPEKLEMKVVCSLTKEQGTLYQAVVDEMLRRIAETEGIERKGLVLATMLRLKQVCNHPAQFLGDGSALAGRSGKLERTVEVLEEVLENHEKALVFTQFAEMGAMLRDHLQQRLGRRVAFLYGGVPRKRRDEMVAELQDPESGVPLMVLSLKAGGTGLNLTAANHVVHFDRWWNPAVENQATDRAFRIGQRRDVQVRKLVCAGTVEDRIDQLIEAKKDLADRIVGSGEGWLTELSTDELAEVFRLSADTVGV